MGGLVTDLFGVKASPCRSERGFLSGKEVVLLPNIVALGPTRAVTATDSMIGGSRASVSYETTVHGIEMAQFPGWDPFGIGKENIFRRFTNVPYPYDRRSIERPETQADLIPSGLLESESIHYLPVGVEPSIESPTPTSESMGEDAAAEDPAASTIDIDEDGDKEVDKEYGGTKIQVKIFNIEK